MASRAIDFALASPRLRKDVLNFQAIQLEAAEAYVVLGDAGSALDLLKRGLDSSRMFSVCDIESDPRGTDCGIIPASRS